MADDVISGLGGDDTISGLSGRDRICGDAGQDSISGGEGTDLLLGGLDNDSLDGGESNDVVIYSGSTAPVDVDLAAGTATGEGSDTLSDVEAVLGSAQGDVLHGDSADNFLFGMGGDDEILGGGGYDYAVYWFSPAPVQADLAAGTATGEGVDSLSEISGLLGSSFDDSLSGDAAANFLDGDEGDDLLEGAEGDDLFLGREGDDIFIGGPGEFDRIDLRGGRALTLSFVSGMASGEGEDRLEEIEGAGGTPGADVLTGDAGTDYFAGRGGKDVVSGGGGDDFLNGSSGQDRGNGGPGTDSCKSFEISKQDCEKKTDAESHPLEVEAEAVQTFRRNF